MASFLPACLRAARRATARTGRVRSGHPRARRMLFALTLVPLLLGGGTAQVNAVAGLAQHAKTPDGQRHPQAAPKQRWGRAGGDPAKAIVTGGTPNTVKPPSYRSKHPLETPPKTPALPANHARVVPVRGAVKRGFVPGRSEELPTHRTATESVYENPDGTLTTEFSSAPINYRKSDGTFARIDTSLRGSKSSFDATHAPTGVTFAKQADRATLAGITLDATHSVRFSLRGAEGVTGRAEGDTVTYRGVTRNVDLELASTGSGAKETLVLRSAQVPTSYVFDLRLTGLTAELVDGAILLSDETGAQRATIPAGFMIDSGKGPRGPTESTGVTYRLSGSPSHPTLRMQLDKAWLNDSARVFPVRVDPSVDTAHAAATGAINVGSGTTSGSTALNVGYKGGSNSAAYVRFDSLVSNLQHHTVYGAALQLTNYDAASCKARAVNVYKVTGSWSTGGSYSYPGPAYSTKLATKSFAYGYIPSTVPATTRSPCPAANTLMDLGVDGRRAVQSWADSSSNNNGITVRAAAGDSGAWKTFAGTSTANAPKLFVTHSPYNAGYAIPKAAPSPTVTQTQDGYVKVTVTNKSAEAWSVGGYYLGVRVYNAKTMKAVTQYKAADLVATVGIGGKTTLNALVKHQPDTSGTGTFYLYDFTMVKAGGKVFTDEQVPPGRLQIGVFNTPPIPKKLYPDNGYQAATLNPQLYAQAIDLDSPTATLKYTFTICPTGVTSGATCTASATDMVNKPSWTVPSGLVWSKDYQWHVVIKDANGAVQSPDWGWISLSTAVPQPSVTSKVAGSPYAGKDQEFDPQVGNVTTAALDAPVISAGPDLNVLRTYNSLDPRRDGLFGEGWTTTYDMSVTTDDDGTGNVVVRYPDGQAVRFGKNPDATYAAPAGRVAGLTWDSTNGLWKLQDRNSMSYQFNNLGKLTKITDAWVRSLVLTYDTAQHLVKAQVSNSSSNTAGRALTFAWTGNHITGASTDAINGAPLTWSYTYTGDRLDKACAPGSICTNYGYTAANSFSHYRSAVQDDRPEAYYRLGETSDATVATSQVAVNLGADAGTYTGVSLGSTGGAIAGSPSTAGTFNGTTSVMGLPNGALRKNRDQAVEMWFRTSATGASNPLIGYQDKALSGTPTLGVPVLYIGSDGKLRGQLSTGTISPVTTTGVVNNGAWHHVVLSSQGSTETMYLDGATVGTRTGTVAHDTLTYDQVGAAYATTPASWAGWGPTSKRFFTGDVDEVALYGRPLGTRAVAAHNAFGRTAADELTQVTLPSGRTAMSAEYDNDTDRVSSYTDKHGGTWDVGAPLVYGSATDLRRTIMVHDPAERPYLYEYDALAGRLLRTGMPTGQTLREEDEPTYAPTDPTPSNCTQVDPGDPQFCTLVPNTASGPVFYTLDGLSVRSFGYDAKGNQNVVTDEMGNTTTMGFDARGNVTSHTTCRVTGPPGSDCHTDWSTYPATVTNQFDPRNDLVTETRDARSANATDPTYRTQYTYAAGGNLATQTNPDGGVVTHTYSNADFSIDGGIEPNGLLTSTKDALGAMTYYEYFKNGDLAKVTEPSGLTTEYTYDVLGRKATETEVSSSTPSPGITSTYGYDGLGRMTAMVEPQTTDGITPTTKHQRKTQYSYDGDGDVTGTTVSDLVGGDAARTTTMDYDDFGNVASVVDAEGNESAFGYDRFGNRTSMTDPNGRKYEYGYTARNTLAQTRLWDWNGDAPGAPSTGEYLVLHNYTFDLAGRMLSDTDSMGRKLDYVYYGDNLLKSLTMANFHKQDGTVAPYVVEADEYDAAGNATKQTAGNGKSVTATTYTATGQVSTSTVDPGGIARRTTWTYDKAGDVLTTSGVGNFSNITWPTVITPETVTYTYDTLGRQKTESQSAGSITRTTTYDYDQRGLLRSQVDPLGNATGATAADHTTAYGYDEMGRQVKVTGAAVQAESNGAAATTVNPVQLTSYDTFDEPVATKDADGNLTKAAYDRLGRPTLNTGTPYTQPGTSTTITPTVATQYDGVGNVTQLTDARNNAVRYTYDRLDRLVGKDVPLTDNSTRGLWRYAYTRTGEVLSVTDPRGAQVQSTYDDLDRPITQTEVERSPADNFTTGYTYDDLGNVLAIKDPSGATTSNTYDTLGQLLTTKDPNNVVTTHGYDPNGREIRTTDGKGRTSRTDFDGFGQVSSESDLAPSGAELRTQSYTYDLTGNLLKATSPLTTNRTYTYDALGRLKQQSEPVTATKSISTSFGYDAAGNRTRYTDGRGNATITKFNSWNMPESVIEPSTTTYPNAADRTWTATYDANANPVKLVAPAGVSRSRTFDAADRLTNETGAGTGSATTPHTFGYDAIGELTSVNTPSGDDTFAYSDRGLMKAAAGPSGAASYDYDRDGNITTRTDAAGTAAYTYENGRLKTEKDGITGATQTLGYDTDGALKTVDYGSGRLRTYGYDDYGHLSSDTLKNSAGATVSSIAYGYDKDDRMTSKTTTGTAGAATNTFGYDLAGRLTSWTKGATTVAYDWDDSGNRIKNGSKTATYDERNRLKSDTDYTYTYSARGTLTGRTSAGATEAFSFDAFDRLIYQGSTGYAYDGLDRVATRAGVAQKYSGLDSDPVSDGVENYAYGAADELLAIGRGTTKRLTLSDQHDDVIGDFDPADTSLTALADSAAYDPFGAVTATAGTKHDVGFQGDYTDPTTGSVNMGARWYLPSSGSFASRDSAAYDSGASILANGYTYGAGDPMDYNDPDGNWPSCGFCHKVTHAVSSAASAVGHVISAGATAVWHGVQAVARTAWSAVKAVGRTIAKAANWVYSKARTAVRWVGAKIASAARWVASRAAAAAAWARQKAEAVRRAAIATAHAVTAKAKAAVAEAVKHNPLPAIKAALKPIMAGVKVVVSAAANLPAAVVQVTRNVVADVAKATNVLYQKAVDAAGVAVDAISDAASAVGEFAQAAAPYVAGAVAGIATTGACLALTMGAGSAACLVAGFTVGGAVTSALTCAPGRSIAGCAARGGASGAVAGVLTVATGGAGAFASGAIGSAGGDAAGQFLENGSVDLQEVAVSGATGGIMSKGGQALGGKLASLRGCNSFVAGTRVLMADGSSKPIEDVQIGDEVLATDPTTGVSSAKEVTDTIVGDGEKHLVALTLTSDTAEGHRVETVTATDGHPFYVTGSGEQLSRADEDHSGHWVDAGDLHKGVRLRTPKGGGTATLTAVREFTQVRTVFNLTVDGIHTFYIKAGDTDVLTHNCGDPLSAYANSLRRPGGSSPRVAAEYTSPEGNTYYGQSKHGLEAEPGGDLDQALTRVGHHRGCAEVSCLIQAERAGDSVTGGSMRAVRVRGLQAEGDAHGTPISPCDTYCSPLLRNLNVSSR